MPTNTTQRRRSRTTYYSGRSPTDARRRKRKIGKAVAQILEERGLTGALLEIGLEASAGVSGGRLTAAQRQKLGLARVLLRDPDVLVLNEATAALDFDTVGPMVETIRTQFKDRTLIWTLSRAEWARQFDQVAVVENARIVESGPISDVDVEGSRFRYFCWNAELIRRMCNEHR